MGICVTLCDTDYLAGSFIREKLTFARLFRTFIEPEGSGLSLGRVGQTLRAPLIDITIYEILPALRHSAQEVENVT
jgi:hypothetical protein